jgi:predicted phage tail protein
MMLRKIKVYGSLAKFLKRRVFKAAVANPAEAVRFLLANFPDVRRHMQDQHYKVLVSDRALQIGDEPDQLHHPVGELEEIKIVPVMAGAGGSTGQILAGIGLIAFSLLLPGIGAAIGGAAMTKIGLIGGVLVLGGISQLLTPVPQSATGADSEQDPRKSYSFSGIQNVSRQGVPVPIVYGETIVGSVTISSTILTDDPESSAY